MAPSLLTAIARQLSEAFYSTKTNAIPIRDADNVSLVDRRRACVGIYDTSPLLSPLHHAHTHRSESNCRIVRQHTQRGCVCGSNQGRVSLTLPEEDSIDEKRGLRA